MWKSVKPYSHTTYARRALEGGNETSNLTWYLSIAFYPLDPQLAIRRKLYSCYVGHRLNEVRYELPVARSDAGEPIK